ncbi:MAG: PD-(D/E)XK nuclease family protein, partial [Planctomycetota bacterium]|nr:PD-(D/E)XK nuclease family protein [Planctomycetota bacterium]
MPDEGQSPEETSGSPAIRRSRIDASSPLAEAARRLLDRPVDELGEVDLGDVLVVLPGARAGRQFLLELEVAADAQGTRAVPPRVLTPAGLPAAIGTSTAVPAEPETWLAAVTASLEPTPDAGDATTDLSALCGPDAGAAERRAVARTVIQADRLVRAGDRDWNRVVEVVGELGGEADRHRTVRRALADATKRLAAFGLVPPEDAIDAAIASIDDVEPSTLPRELLLLGVVDPAVRDRRLISRLAAAGTSVTAMMIGESADVDCFDAFGAVRLDAWADAPPRPALDSIRVEAAPFDEIMAVDEALQTIADRSDGVLDPDEVAVVLADETRGPGLARELAARGIPVHLAAGRPLSATPIARTIEALRAWCLRPDTANLAGLLVDPAIGRAIRNGLVAGDPEVSLNAWASEHLPALVEGEWWRWPEEEGAHEQVLAATDEIVRRRLGGFAVGAAAAVRPLVDWIADLLERLRIIDEEIPDGVWSSTSLEGVRDAVSPLLAIPTTLSPRLAAAEAIEIVVELLGRTSLPDPGRRDALETIGWLEAPFDPAGRLVVTGMHDDAVPGRTEDPLLPESLRSALGLEDDRRRAARDRWVLSTMLARDPHAAFLVSRRDDRGEPLVPSRLLFGITDAGSEGGGEAPTSDPHDLARRVGRLFDQPPVRRAAGAASSAFDRVEPPQPGTVDSAAPRSLSVTAFRDYLASPYRFWLRRILRLDTRVPVGDELDPRLFGLVLHDAVEFFGRAEIARLRSGEDPSLDVERVWREMLDGMERSLRGRVSAAVRERSPAIRLQARILEARLRRVAEVQVRRSLDRWRIHDVEVEIDRELEIPGQEPMRVRGRIDRIDLHPTHGWQLLDFKTSDRGKGP